MLKFAVALLLCSVVACSLLGQWTDADVDDEVVVEAATHAAKELSKQANTPYHLKLQKVTKARSQLVAGVNYDLKVIVGVTQCRKHDVDYADVEKCEFQNDVSTYRLCNARVYKGTDGHHELQSSACVLAA